MKAPSERQALQMIAQSPAAMLNMDQLEVFLEAEGPLSYTDRVLRAGDVLLRQLADVLNQGAVSYSVTGLAAARI
ncbi:MAG: hypothetical protein RDU20_23495 [Desulfomonilaceae bacterium]|nr:hypothetical protein [Desulfomonilaceae bacterium]